MDEKSERFLAEYEELCRKHKITVDVFDPRTGIQLISFSDESELREHLADLRGDIPPFHQR